MWKCYLCKNLCKTDILSAAELRATWCYFEGILYDFMDKTYPEKLCIYKNFNVFLSKITDEFF